VKSLRIIIWGVIFLTLTQFVYSQQESKELYIFHQVKKGETYYSIAQKYNVKVADIRAANPDLTDILPENASLRIPQDQKLLLDIKNQQQTPQKDEISPAAPEKKTEPEQTYHVVKQGETVFSISKNYGVSIDSLLANNKKIVNNRIIVGETLKIPSYKNLYDFIEYRAEKKEPLVDIANRFQISLKELKKRNTHLGNNVSKNEVVFIPIQKKMQDAPSQPDKPSGKTETPSSTEILQDLLQSEEPVCIGGWDTKKKFTVALILPFSSEKIPTNVKKQNLKQLNVNDFKSVPFYNGVVVALDDLKEKGLSVRLNVYDVISNTQMEQLLEKSEMKTTDLIIGMIPATAFKKIADFSNQHNIPLINVASSNNDILKGYPNVAKIVPDEFSICHTTHQILPENKNANILIVRRDTSLFSKSVAELKAVCPNYKEFLNGGKGMSSALTFLDSHRPNYVFMFSKNTPEILDLMRVFDEKRKQYDITLVGYPTWNAIPELDYRYAHNLKLHFIVPQVVDYNEQNVKDFVSTFRERFNSEPNMSAFQGYDITYNFLSALGTFGNNCLECFNHIPHHFLSTGDIILNNTPANGYNNQYWNVYTVKEYEVVRVTE
jgi:LysM repeat protein